MKYIVTMVNPVAQRTQYVAVANLGNHSLSPEMTWAKKLAEQLTLDDAIKTVAKVGKMVNFSAVVEQVPGTDEVSTHINLNALAQGLVKYTEWEEWLKRFHPTAYNSLPRSLATRIEIFMAYDNFRSVPTTDPHQGAYLAVV